MNNYYHKYLKYKYKYLNLLEKTKRTRDNDEKKSADIKKIKINNYQNFSRDSIFMGLFNMYVSESVFELNPKYLTTNNAITNKTNFDNNVKNKTYPSHNYNLRGVEFKLRKETKESYIGSYTPEIIRNLQSNGVSSRVIDELVENFKCEDLKNVEILNNEDLYVDFDNYGKNIECWVADNMYCPCCGVKSLRRYVRDNMPCIDLICSNNEHKFSDGVKFFQVKAKYSSITNEHHKNFNYLTKQIHTGSKAIGQYPHSIKTYEDYYTLLMGYICIEYQKKFDIIKSNEIIEILSNSFIVLPKIYINVSKVLFDFQPIKKYNNKLDLAKEQVLNEPNKNPKLYYWYIDTNSLNSSNTSNISKNTIEFSTINNDIIFLNSYNKTKLFDSVLKMNFIATDYNPKLPLKWIKVPNPFNK